MSLAIDGVLRGFWPGKRTALDGRVWWSCYFTNREGEPDSFGKFKRKKDAEAYIKNYLCYSVRQNSGRGVEREVEDD